MAGPKPLTRPKAPVKTCPSGHRQRLNWKPGDDCGSCAERERAAALHDPAVAARFRADELAMIGELPPSFTIRSGDGLSVRTYGVPRRLTPRRKRA